MARRGRNKFDLQAKRRREIVSHARHVGAAKTDDFSRWLIAWVWHNQQNRKDQIGALIEAARRMGCERFTPAQAEAVFEEASRTRRHMKADNLARFLGVSFLQREALKLTAIGSFDVGKRARKELRKRKNRLAQEKRRRAKGAKPWDEYLASSRSATKPWEGEGISRANWYRKRARALETSPCTPTPTPTPEVSAMPETSPCTPIFLSPVHAPVSPEGQEGAGRQGYGGETAARLGERSAPVGSAVASEPSQHEPLDRATGVAMSRDVTPFPRDADVGKICLEPGVASTARKTGRNKLPRGAHVEFRTCSRCETTKPFTREFFTPHPACRDGLSGWCRKCKAAANVRHRDRLRGGPRIRKRILPGMRFNRLTAIALTKQPGRTGMWLWKCDCGAEHVARGTHVTGGKTMSCGCRLRELQYGAAAAAFRLARSRKALASRWGRVRGAGAAA
jgi:hypothetical protein